MSKETKHNWYLANRQLTIDRAAKSYENNRQKIIDRSTKWAKDNPERKAEIAAKSDKKQRAKHPEKMVARNAVNNALRDGRLVKEPCHC